MAEKKKCENCRFFLPALYSFLSGSCMFHVLMGFEWSNPITKKYNDICSDWEEDIDPQDKRGLVDGFFTQMDYNKKYRTRIRKERKRIEDRIKKERNQKDEK